ncbi:MAG: hypothetical protein R2862_04435 [Thermoanaerobaculia bacterium]
MLRSRPERRRTTTVELSGSGCCWRRTAASLGARRTVGPATLKGCARGSVRQLQETRFPEKLRHRDRRALPSFTGAGLDPQRRLLALVGLEEKVPGAFARELGRP